MGAITVPQENKLVKDIAASKIKAYGYKSLFAMTAGFIVQVCALPLYVCTYKSKYRNLALAFSELGVKIIKGEMTIINWGWTCLDLLLFGQPIPITENMNFALIRNASEGELMRTIENFIKKQLKRVKCVVFSLFLIVF